MSPPLDLKLCRDRNFGEVSNMPFAAKLPEKLAILPYLPARLTNPSISGASKSTRGKRGGAHNRADRLSEGLTEKQVGNLIGATRLASAIGLPFTRMITIHWQHAGIPMEEMVKATGRFLDLLSKALKRWGCETAWLYAHEGGEEKGGHCHILAHVPAALVKRVSKMQNRWLRIITGMTYRRGTICSKPIGGLLGLEKSNPELHTVNLAVAFFYLLKGANADAADAFDLARLEPGGCVIGKRCGTSQNIGTKAQSHLGETA